MEGQTHTHNLAIYIFITSQSKIPFSSLIAESELVVGQILLRCFVLFDVVGLRVSLRDRVSLVSLSFSEWNLLKLSLQMFILVLGLLIELLLHERFPIRFQLLSQGGVELFFILNKREIIGHWVIQAKGRLFVKHASIYKPVQNSL